MKNEYKKIYADIKPSDEIFKSVIAQKDMPSQKAKYFKPILSVACLFAAVAVLFSIRNFSNDSFDENKIVNLIVAYETKNSVDSVSHVKQEIVGDTKTVYIDADVIIESDIKNMKAYTAIPSFDFYEEFEEILLGKDALFRGNADRTSISFPVGGGINFGVSSEKNKSEIQNQKSENHAAGCRISYLEAKQIADSFVERFSVDGFIFQNGKIADDPTYGSGYSATGFYVFNYLQYQDGFPLAVATDKIESGVASELSVYVNDEGIIYVRFFSLELNEKPAQSKVMSVYDAIELIENNVDNLWLSEYAPIVEIRLEYLLDRINDGIYELVPCWHFCIDQTEIFNLGISEARKNDTNDLCVNAITGEMFRVADRYPVYKTKDGIISTWNG